MSATLPVLRGTPRGAAIAMPIWQSYRLQDEGQFVGFDSLSGETTYLDFITQRLPDASGKPGTGNSNVIVAGGQDAGKSTFIKNVSIIMSMLQYYDFENGPVELCRILAEDHRMEGGVNEMRPLTKWFKGTTISSSDVRGLNYLHPDLGLSELQELDLSVAFAESDLGRELDIHESEVMRVAVWRMHSCRDDIVSTPFVLRNIFKGMKLEDVFAYDKAHESNVLRYQDPTKPDDPETLKRLREAGIIGRESTASEKDLLEAANRLAKVFGHITGPRYGHLLGADISPVEIFTDRFTCINWSAFTDKALGQMQLLMWKLDNYNLINNRPDRCPHLHIVDELHRIVTDQTTVTALQENVNTSRSRSTVNIFSTQYLSQVINAGGENSLVRGAARNIMKGIGTFVIFKPSEIDAESLDTYAQIGFSPKELRIIRALEQGQFAIKLPGREAKFSSLQIVPDVIDLIRTNKARDVMIAGRRPVADFKVPTVDLTKGNDLMEAQ